MFKSRLREKFIAPPTTSDSHRVIISFRNEADGRLTNVRVVKSSGNKEFDDAVLLAMRLVSMSARPDGKAEDGLEFEFSAREKEDR
jgi:TonB family protein